MTARDTRALAKILNGFIGKGPDNSENSVIFRRPDILEPYEPAQLR